MYARFGDDEEAPKMKIGLLDIDRHNFPNLALMKLSSWYKSNGYQVEFATIFEHYDKLFKSKVFSFSANDTTCYDAEEIETGGTGYGNFNNLPEKIEHIYPDYSLYNIDYSLGFSTRGCIRNCSFCIVPKKEGYIKPNAEIYEFWKDQKDLVFMDNNIVAHDFGLQQIENAIKENIRIDCNQGLDARIIAKDVEIQKLLARAKWCNSGIRLACDHKSQMEPVKKSIEAIRSFTKRKIDFFVYTLIQDDIQDAIDRIYFMRDMYRVFPFAQPYRDFTTNREPLKIQKQLARWCNMRSIFRSVEWKDYKKG